MALTPSSPEKAPSLQNTLEESGKLIVTQPLQLTKLNELLVSLENFEARVSERVGEDKSGDMGGAGQGSGTQQDDSQLSARDLAIQNIPAPMVIRVKLKEHIQSEVKLLEKLAKRTRSASQPGGAYMLNEIYSKIRRLNTLLVDLLDASVDLLKKLFIRVFIDQQPIL